MQPSELPTLRSLTFRHAAAGPRFLADAEMRLALDETRTTGWLEGGAAALRGRSVLIRTRRQVVAVLAMLELDGVARRILLCPPDVSDAQLPAILAGGEVDAAVTDTGKTVEGIETIAWRAGGAGRAGYGDRPVQTGWVLFTSGTSGAPKLVLHNLASLVGPMAEGPAGNRQVWSTFYDVRRYGGLQMLLRALVGGGSMVLSDAGESVNGFLARLAAAGVSHLSGTPSHWRRVLMSGATDRIKPAYVRLSGEPAGQDILDRLHQAYPAAEIAHAFASTEAGVGFEVRDGLAGFPPAVLAGTGGAVEVRVEDETLRIRSRRTAAGYLGAADRTLVDAAGFVDTGDIVALRDGRYHFLGRREGIVNVGGLKVHPEEVETVINRHPAVLVSRVRGRDNPITGTLVAADVVLCPTGGEDGLDFATIKSEIVAACRDALPPHKVPVQVKRVPDIPLLASGKVARHHA